MTDRHVRHEEYEANPWHQRAVHVVCDQIDTGRAVGECAEAIPEVEKADNVEERDGNDEGIFLPWLTIRETL